MLKRVAFILMSVSLLGLVATAVAVVRRLTPAFYMLLL